MGIPRGPLRDGPRRRTARRRHERGHGSNKCPTGPGIVDRMQRALPLGERAWGRKPMSGASLFSQRGCSGILWASGPRPGAARPESVGPGVRGRDVRIPRLISIPCRYRSVSGGPAARILEPRATWVSCQPGPRGRRVASGSKVRRMHPYRRSLLLKPDPPRSRQGDGSSGQSSQGIGLTLIRGRGTERAQDGKLLLG